MKKANPAAAEEANEETPEERRKRQARERARAWYEEHKAEVNAASRARYAEDAEYRAKVLAASRTRVPAPETREAQRDRNNRRDRERRASDSEWARQQREQKAAARRARMANPAQREHARATRAAWVERTGWQPSEEAAERKRTRERERVREKRATATPGMLEAMRAGKQAVYARQRQEPAWVTALNAKRRIEYASRPEMRDRLVTYARTYRHGRTPERRVEDNRKVQARNRARYANEPQYRLSRTLRGRLRIALRGHRAGHRVSAVRDLGCSLEEYVAYLEGLFTAGMDWDNYGARPGCWTIDHVRPLVSFDLSDPEQQRAAVHYSNTQPMWLADNIRKGSKRSLSRPASYPRAGPYSSRHQRQR